MREPLVTTLVSAPSDLDGGEQVGQAGVEGRLPADEGHLGVGPGQQPGQGEDLLLGQDRAAHQVGEGRVAVVAGVVAALDEVEVRGQRQPPVGSGLWRGCSAWSGGCPVGGVRCHGWNDPLRQVRHHAAGCLAMPGRVGWQNHPRGGGRDGDHGGRVRCARLGAGCRPHLARARGAPRHLPGRAGQGQRDEREHAHRLGPDRACRCTSPGAAGVEALPGRRRRRPRRRPPAGPALHGLRGPRRQPGCPQDAQQEPAAHRDRTAHGRPGVLEPRRNQGQAPPADPARPDHHHGRRRQVAGRSTPTSPHQARPGTSRP